MENKKNKIYIHLADVIMIQNSMNSIRHTNISIVRVCKSLTYDMIVDRFGSDMATYRVDGENTVNAINNKGCSGSNKNVWISDEVLKLRHS